MTAATMPLTVARGAALAWTRAIPAWARDALIAAGLFAAQAVLVAPLFAGPFTQERGSIEATFIANALFIAQHFPDLSWYRDWYLGFPFELHYTPLLPGVVALLGTVIGDVPTAYRIVAAVAYALGPAAVFVLARTISRSRVAGLAAAAVFTLLPSLSYVFPTLLADGQGFSGSLIPAPWRLVVLVRYGEGPHVLSLSLALFAVSALIAYVRRPTSGRLAAAVALLVAVAMTNLIGAFGVALFALGVAIAPSDVVPQAARWSRLIRAGALTVAFSLAWYSVGFLVAFSRPSGGDSAGGYVFFGVAAGAIWALTRIPALARLPRGLDLALVWTSLAGAIVALRQISGLSIAPQPIRYAIEMDAAFAIALGIGCIVLVERLRTTDVRRVVVVAAIVAGSIGLPGWIAVQSKLAPAPDWQSWSERRVALWLADHLSPGERVYATGDHAFWLNVFADVPQVRGGQDFSEIDPWPAHAAYQINTGADADISVLWLRALGARYVVVPGPTSTEVYRDFTSPGKFDGILPLAFDERGVRIYEVPPAGAPSAVTGLSAGIVPTNGADRQALETYVIDLDRSHPAHVERIGESALRVSYDAAPGDALVIREAYDTGWRASIEGYPLIVEHDALGQIVIRVPAGRHVVELQHRVHTDLLIGILVALGAALAFAARPLVRAHPLSVSPRAQVIAGAAVVAAGAALIGALLGAWSGFPKGSDAANHLTRLKFAADHFPHDGWLYFWSAGMPSFDNYPGLPYVAGIPFVHAIGEIATLELFALLAMIALGMGVYGHVLERGRGPAIALLATLLVLTSMSVWHFIVAGGVYARVIAMGFGALAWWTHARWLRTGHGRWLALTAVLLAASISSHQVTGAFAALYVAVVHMGALRVRGIRSLAVLAGVTALLSAQPIVSPMLLGLGGRMLGVDRADLGATRPDALWSPLHMGIAAFSIPVLAIAVAALRSPAKALAALVPIGVLVAYIYAPNLGVPTRYYYVNGIDPATVTYFLAIVGALAFAAVAPSLRDHRGRAVAGIAAIAIGLNTIVAVPAMRPSGYVLDIGAPYMVERLARETLVVDGNDVRHRILPLTASEQVWFNYVYAKPSLRDYYTFGIVSKDWNFWAFHSIYDDPSVTPDGFRAILDWFALDSITVPPGDKPQGDAAFAASPDLALVASTKDRSIRQYDVVDPSTIAVTSRAPVVVVVASASGYDQRARLLFDDGASPRTRNVVWWQGTLADLPDDLRVAASSVLVVGDRVGDPALAENVARALTARGGRVVWDVDGVKSGTLPEPWPVTSIGELPISRWDVTDASGRIGPNAFGPAEYDGGPWNAPIGEGLRSGASVDLDLAGRPLIASRTLGTGTVTVIGGNLLYHALDKNAADERAYLASFLGAKADRAASEPTWRFVDPERREIETDGSVVVLKESLYPKWSASWVGDTGVRRDLPIRYAGPGLMLVVPPGAGTVVFQYRSTDTLGWLAWALTLAGIVAAAFIARRNKRVLPEERAAVVRSAAASSRQASSGRRLRRPSWLQDDQEGR